MNESSQRFLSGLLAGLVVGAIVAVLFAPEKGERTRKRLAKASGTWQGKASDALDSASELVEKGRKRMGI